MPIKHAFTSPKGDSGDPDVVGSNEWNADHEWGIPHLYVGTTPPIGPLSSATAPVANRGTFVKFICTQSLTLTTVSFRIVTSAGNLDYGIYSLAGSRLASTGSFASPGSATSNTRALSNSVDIVAGSAYWFAMAQSSASLRVPGPHPAAVIAGSGWETYFTLDATFPLPSSVTLPAAFETTAFLPAFYFV